MTKTRARTLGIGVPLLFALLLLVAGPATAHHKSSHTKGGGKGKASSGWTEDNDTNDGGTPNNVADEGDNRHPSGKDRSVEKGGSGTQGGSTSDPDDNGRGPDRSNGGADKPNGPGGIDLADQDGNNGCGNDDDFEDDNEGWCGGKPKKEKAAKARFVDKPNKVRQPKVDDKEASCDEVESDEQDKDCAPTSPEITVPCAVDATMDNDECDLISDNEDRVVEDKVLGETITRPDAGIAAGSAAVAGTTTVAGESADRSPSVLPLTGSGALNLLRLAGLLMLAGFVMLRARRGAQR